MNMTEYIDSKIESIKDLAQTEEDIYKWVRYAIEGAFIKGYNTGHDDAKSGIHMYGEEK